MVGLPILHHFRKYDIEESGVAGAEEADGVNKANGVNKVNKVHDILRQVYKICEELLCAWICMRR